MNRPHSLIARAHRSKRGPRFWLAGWLAAVLTGLLGLVPVLAANGPTSSVALAASSCGTTDVAIGKPTTASSVQSSSYPASNATDGNTSTRWSSAFSDPQWLQVDLGSAQSICGVTIIW